MEFVLMEREVGKYFLDFYGGLGIGISMGGFECGSRFF